MNGLKTTDYMAKVHASSFNCALCIRQCNWGKSMTGGGAARCHAQYTNDPEESHKPGKPCTIPGGPCSDEDRAAMGAG